MVNVRWLNATAWYGLYLSRLLKEAGHPVMVLGLPGTKSFACAEEWGLEPVGLPLTSGNPFTVASLYFKLRSLVREFQPDIVNCHRGESFALWGMLKKFGAPFALVRTRGDQRPPKNSAGNRYLHAKAADALIATNSRIASFLVDGLGVNPGKVFTILGGVDKKTFYPDPATGLAVRRKLGFMESDFVVGILGRLDPVKGHEILINALGRLRREQQGRFNIRFLCVGADANLKSSDIRNMLRNQGLEDRSIITGRVKNVRACINCMDLGVLASVSSEAIARAALEIMACGKPLLSTDVGVMPDLLPEYALVPPDDYKSMAKALEAAWLNPDVYARLGAAAARAVAGLDGDGFLKATLEAYAVALGR